MVGVSSIVGRPLAAVIARDRDAVREPADLEGGEVGVTGPAVRRRRARLGARGRRAPSPSSVRRVTIGFDAVATLAAGQLDAATAFWNAEGVALRELGVPTREFRVDDYGAPRYPELILATSAETLRERPRAGRRRWSRRPTHGYDDLEADPEAALADLLDAVPELDPDEQRRQLEALTGADAFRLAGPARPRCRSRAGRAGTASTGSSRASSTSSGRFPSSTAIR